MTSLQLKSRFLQFYFGGSIPSNEFIGASAAHIVGSFKTLFFEIYVEYQQNSPVNAFALELSLRSIPHMPINLLPLDSHQRYG